MLAKIKLGLFLLVALFALVIICLNLSEVEVHLIVATLKMPQAILLLATLLIGFLLGLAANALWKVRAWRAKAKAKSKIPPAPTEA